MNQNLLKILLSTDNKKLEEKRKSEELKPTPKEKRLKWNESYGN